MRLTPIGSEIESIIAAVVVFLAGGLLSFACCFAVTHVYLFYKRRMTRRQRRHENRAEKMGEDSSAYIILDEDGELSLSDEYVSPSEVKVVGSRHINRNGGHRSDRKKHTLTKEQIEKINQKGQGR